MKLNRVLVLLNVLLVSALVARADLASIFTNAAPATRPAQPRLPSIVFIQCHGLGYGDLSCDGQTNFQTPNLDQLAASGVRFTNYQVGGAGTAPLTRAALLLGRDPGGRRQLAADDLTLAECLQQAGYHTGLIGEWDLGGDNTSGAPWRQGFDQFAGYFETAETENYYAEYMWRHDGVAGPTRRSELHSNLGGLKGQYVPDLFTKAAVNFIQQNHPDAFNHNRPFFLLLDYTTPRPNLLEAGRGGNGLQVPTDAPFSEERWPAAEKNRAAMITRLDGHIGQLTAKLQELGMTNNVVIFFTSVSVPEATGGVDPAFFHSQASTNDFRVPMIARWSGSFPTGMVSGLAWSARDFATTALGIARRKPPGGFAGRSILPDLTRPPVGKPADGTAGP